MGESETEKAVKPEKHPPAGMDHNNIHVYPDWAAMQAYYGPRLAVPPPYMNSAVASTHGAPAPYMWGPPPQSMIPPYGNPYAAFYAHGGAYAHAGVPMPGTTLGMETPVKSPGSGDGGFVKKLKEFDGLAMSIGNGNIDSGENGTDHKMSESSEDTDDSSGGSNGVMSRTLKSCKKRSRQESPNSDCKAQEKVGLVPAVQYIPANVTPTKSVENLNTALVIKDASDVNGKPDPTAVPQPSMPNEGWLQNDRELKRERRKQSNRESARRSRLRKQAEAEELAAKVQILTAESIALKSERNKLIESSEKLRLENEKLKVKLENGGIGQTEEVKLHQIDDMRVKPVSTINLLARVNNSDSADSTDEDDGSYENRSPGAKLHQLLDAKPRTDAIVAG